MIITGGFNVFSAEVERVLLAHPAVRTARSSAARRQMGRARHRRGGARPGHPARAEVRSFVKERLGSVKAPEQVEVWPALPRSTVGKVLKVDIKARLRDQA